MKEKLSLINLAKIYFYLEGKEDLEDIKKKYSSISRNMKRFNIQGTKRDNKTYFSQEETLLLCSNGLKEAKALRGLSFKEIQELEEKACSFYQKEEKNIPSKWHNKALGFMLSTGRRTIEVIDKGEFSLSKKENYLSMKEVVKKREEGITIEFPVLYKENILLEVIQEVKENKISHMDLYNYCVKNYKEVVPSLHSLRRLYGAYSLYQV